MLGWVLVADGSWVDVWRRRLRGSERRRTVSEAVLTFLAGAVFVVVEFVDVLGGAGAPTSPLALWEHLVTLAVGCGLLLLKRRAPGRVLVAVLVVFAVDVWLGGSLGLILVLFDAVYGAALRGSARVLAAVQVGAVVVIVAVLGAVLVATRDVRLAFFAGLQVFAIGVSALWWGMSVRHHDLARRLAEARADDARRLAEAREHEVRTDERARMARDLHDAIAGNLSAIALHAEAALARPADDDGAPPRDRAALEAVRAASVSSLVEMRAMILLLRSGEDAVAAPSRLVDVPDLVGTTRAAGHGVVLDVDAGRADLPAAVDQAAYRIVQESLTNAVKHAPGGHSRVRVGRADGALCVEVTTSAAVGARAGASGPVSDRAAAGLAARPGPAAGGGADGAGGEGFGLLSMRERAESLGGDFTAGWADDGAWTVRARLPLGDV